MGDIVIGEQKNPEEYLRGAIRGIEIRSVLDVGTGHSGVFDYWYWQSRNIKKVDWCHRSPT